MSIISFSEPIFENITIFYNKKKRILQYFDVLLLDILMQFLETLNHLRRVMLTCINYSIIILNYNVIYVKEYLASRFIYYAQSCICYETQKQ